MMDVVPPKEGQSRNKKKKPADDALELTWKLPARLRRPIRDEMKRQQTQAARRRKIISFERRPVTTKTAASRPPSFNRRAPKNRGAEHHTGDVYMNSRPDLRLSLPPHNSRNTRGGRQAPARRQAVSRQAVKKQAKKVLATGKPETAAAPTDPFSAAPVTLPGNRLGMKPTAPAAGWFLLSFKPRRWGLNLIVLLLGCLMAFGAVGILRQVNSKGLELGVVRDRAELAYRGLWSAGAALAEGDIERSQAEFSNSQDLLQQAQLEMDQALLSSQAILKYIDVTGTIRSGEELLLAGSFLTEAGQHMGRGIGALADSSSSTLGEVVKVAQEEFGLAEVALGQAGQSLGKVGGPLVPDEVKEQIERLDSSIPVIREMLLQFNRQSDVLLAVLGADRERQYLLLFQNNHEIRPTGGFIGSIALVDIDQGRVEEIDVKSVYEGDGQLQDFIAPPEPLRPIANRWYLRDANWFVDYPTSAKKVAEFFEKEGGPTVDGVIALTPEVIRALIRVTGPIEMPEYGVVVDEANFWSVTQDQVTYSYDEQLNKPKQFLADLTPRLLQRLLGGQVDSAGQVLSALATSIRQKDLLIYFKDEEHAQALREAGWSGELPRDRPGMLAINNANIGGHKSDQFIEQAIDVRYEVRADGDVDVILSVQRSHRGPQEASGYEYPTGENPATKSNIVWQRVLVPDGAELVDAQGFTRVLDIPQWEVPDDNLPLTADRELTEWQRGQVRHGSGTTIGREAGYTFFGNWIVTEPGETSVTVYQYRLPRAAETPNFLWPAKRFETMIIKQPGDKRTNVRVSLKLPDNLRVLHTVPDDGVTRATPNEMIYRGSLNRDIVVGAVYEKY